MESQMLHCQVCLSKYNKFCSFKCHLGSNDHKKKMSEIFKKDVFQGSGYIPNIIVVNPHITKEIKQPILGLSLLTVCFRPDNVNVFYLCHVCEEKCTTEEILSHLSSGEHNINYFNYTDPNRLSFSWIPCKNLRVHLTAEIVRNVNKDNPREIQMLDLPKTLLDQCAKQTYSEVMHSLCEHERLLHSLEAVKRKRTMIEAYQKDVQRKNPLLGMQHVVECICVGQIDRRYYLCTLCNLTFATHTIIKHVLSFDHIYCYFKVWHPSTLLSKESYSKYSDSFASMMLNLAKQAEEIHRSAPTDMRQLSLEPDVFASVTFSCYAEALKKLESITKEKEERSLILSVKPGSKLKVQPVSAPSNASTYSVQCQNCRELFRTFPDYLKHVRMGKHTAMIKKARVPGNFGQGLAAFGQPPNVNSLKKLKEILAENKFIVGASLIVLCFSSQVQAEPIFVCFACNNSLPESLLGQHLHTWKHVIHSLLYLNPWRLPFGWQNSFDMYSLLSMAKEEEKERGQSQMVLKVLDIPHGVFSSLVPPNYQRVMKGLVLYHTLLRRDVPLYRTTKQNERFPLLGLQFIVKHDVTLEWRQTSGSSYLCLLCQTRLSKEHCHAHVFSWEHVAKFLDGFHPGSLDSTTANKEALLDLAKQAARIHPVSHIQEIRLESPIWEPCCYSRATQILAAVKKRDGRGPLEPPIVPKMKLVPRETPKEEDKSQVGENSPKNSQMIEASEEKTSEESPVKSETIPKEINKEAPVKSETIPKEINKEAPVKSETIPKEIDQEAPVKSETISKEIHLEAEISDKACTESGENAGATATQVTVSKQEIKSEEEMEMRSETSSEEEKEAREKFWIKEEPMAVTTSELTPQISQNTYKDDGAGTGKEESKSSKDDPMLSKDTAEKGCGKKRPSSLSTSSPDKHPDQREKSCKRQRLLSKEDESCEEAQKILSRIKTETSADDGESCSSSQQTGFDKGAGALVKDSGDQSDAVYLGESRALIIPEKDLSSHVSQFNHQKLHPVVVDMEIDEDSDSAAEPASVTAALVMTEATHKKTARQNLSPGSSDVCHLDLIKVPEAAGGTNTRTTASRNGEDSPRACPFTAGTKTTLHHPSYRGTKANSHTEMTSSKIVTPINRTAISKIPISTVTSEFSVTSSSKFTARTSSFTPVTTSLTANIPTLKGTSSSCTTTTSILVENASKCTAAPSISTTTAAKLGKTVCRCAPSCSNTTTAKLRETPNGCIVTPSSGTAVASLDATKPNCKTEAAKSTVPTHSHKTPTAPCKDSASKCTTSNATAINKLGVSTPACTTATSKIRAANSTGSTVVLEATCRTAPASKTENASKNSAFKSNVCRASVGTSSGESSEASAKTLLKKNSAGSDADVEPHIHKIPPQAPHLLTNITVRPQHKSPTEPMCTTASRSKPAKRHPELGIFHWVIAFCKGSQQEFCQLCCIRVKGRIHLTRLRHHYNYMKSKYPEWSAKPAEVAKKLGKEVAHLAEIESDVGLQTPKVIELDSDEYDKLAALPDNKAIQRMNWLLKQRDLELHLPAAKSPKQKAVLSSPHDASSPNHVTQQEDFAASVEAEVQVTTPDTLELVAKTHHETPGNRLWQESQVPGLKDTQKKSPSVFSAPPAASVNTEQQNRFEPGQTAELLPDSGCRPVPGHHGASQEDPMISRVSDPERLDAGPTDSESTHTFIPAAEKDQETLEIMQQPESLETDLKDTPLKLEHSLRMFPSECVGPDQNPPADSVTMDQQNVLGPSQTEEHALKDPVCRPGPRHHSASQMHPMISRGERTQDCSHLSRFLWVKSGREDTIEPIIGLASVWECRGISENSFYLCESCSEKLSLSDICKHVSSTRHLLQCLLRYYSHFLTFWEDDDLPAWMKLDISKDLACELSKRERFYRMDSQVIILQQEMYDYVRRAPFSEALNILQDITKKDTRNVLGPPVGMPQEKGQQPEDPPSLEENCRRTPTEMHPVPVFDTDKNIENEARQTWKHMQELAAVVGDSDCIKRDQKPQDVICGDLKAGSVGPVVGSCMSPELLKTCRDFSVQVSPPSFPQLDFLVKDEDLPSESPSSSTAGPDLTRSASPQDEGPPPRNRQAIETLIICTNNLQYNEALPSTFRGSSPKLVCQPRPECASESHLMPLTSQQQNPVSQTLPDIQVKEEDFPTQSTSSSNVGPGSCQTLLASPKDEGPLSRKRQAVEYVETFTKTSSLQLNEPLRVGCRSGSPQPVSQADPESTSGPTSVTSVATSTHLSPKVQDLKNIPTVKLEDYELLMALLKHRKSMRYSCKSVAGNPEFSNNPTKHLKPVLTACKNKTRWDSKWQPLKSTVEPPATSSWGAEPVVSSCENQQVVPNANLMSSSSTDSSLTKVNAAIRVAEGTAADSTKSTTAAKPGDLQHQGSVTAQSTTGDVTQPQHKGDSVVTTSDSGQIQQPQCNIDTAIAGGFQHQIPVITRKMPKHKSHQSIGGYKDQNQSKAGHQVSHTYPTVPTAVNTPPAADYLFSQMTEATIGHHPCDAGAVYRAPDNNPVYPGPLPQPEGLPSQGLYLTNSCVQPNQYCIGQTFVAANSCATPAAPGWMNLEMQQQQQHPSWTHATPPAGYNDAPPMCVVPFIPAANQSPLQMWANLNENSGTRFIQAQNAHSMMWPMTSYGAPALIWMVSGEHAPEPLLNPSSHQAVTSGAADKDWRVTL